MVIFTNNSKENNRISKYKINYDIRFFTPPNNYDAKI